MKERKYYMSNRLFLHEVQMLKTGDMSIPSKIFCKKFLNRLDEGREVISEQREGIWPQPQDEPYILGYALLGDTKQDATELAKDIKIYEWVELYAAIDHDDIKAVEDVIIEILDLEEKWGYRK